MLKTNVHAYKTRIYTNMYVGSRSTHIGFAIDRSQCLYVCMRSSSRTSMWFVPPFDCFILFAVAVSRARLKEEGVEVDLPATRVSSGLHQKTSTSTLHATRARNRTEGIGAHGDGKK